MADATSTLTDWLPSRDAPGDELLDLFLRYVDSRGLSLYAAQEEAILALLEGQNVILNTPTGSGKSLVASAMIFAALARGERSVYTCPIKALVNEKWMALCREFGPDQVGLSTGDATVNRDAPILCCTAEVLSNIALREGEHASFNHVVMDEFHYYADRDRGVAWQVPLLTMPTARFLLMSATLGDTTPFEAWITRLNGLPTVSVKSVDRPVPLDYAYAEIPLPHTIEKLVDEGRTPAYVVHFTQADAAASAQDFTSLKIATKEQKAEIAARIEAVDFSSPYGPSIRKWLRHGIGLHHAGLLPKYRVVVEQLAQLGLLRVICGTDTLGAGINVPIRTVVITKLCKFDGQKTSRLSAREFHQIAGRAGRKGFDDRGYVVVQAPEHVVENLRLAEKAGRDGRKFVKRKPPDHNYVDWDLNVFTRLIGAPPEPLVSRFQVTHGMLLNVLSRPTDGCQAMRVLIRDSHEQPAAKTAHRRRAWQLFRALVQRRIVEIAPPTPEGAKVRVNVDLQDDFSMDQVLSLYLIETIPLLDAQSPTYAPDVLTLVESILENPELILRRQLDRLKGLKVAEMKAEGMEYDERMAELEKLEYPKPLRDFVYDTFNAFADRHPWVDQENIRPKSIAREMFETYKSFAEYVLEYDLERSEGLLLRHLNSVYKALSQTVPAAMKTDDVLEIEWYLRTLVRTADASLAEEWERMRDPNYVPLGPGRGAEALVRKPQAAAPYDLTADAPAFLAAIRARVFTALKAWAHDDGEAAVAALDAPTSAEAQASTPPELKGAFEAFTPEHGGLRFDPEARNARHTHVDRREAPARWLVQQVLVDANDLNDWAAEFDVDVEASRDRQQPVLWLRRIGPIG
ncbi:MAG: DEAD/DEAH box helicase [Vicinamibacterales bacterium]